MPRGTVSVGGSTRYGELAETLKAEGLALGNLASLPHISVAGAVATATHGSGDANGNLATAVAGDRARHVERRGHDRQPRRCRLRRDRRRARRARRGHARHARRRARLRGAPARLRGSCLGCAVRGLRRAHRERLQRERVHPLGRRDRPGLGQEPRRRKRPSSCAPSSSARSPRRVDRHPILGLDPINCTPQLGVPGPWAERLPHFRMGFTPSNGEEIQSEYLLRAPARRGGDPGAARAGRRDAAACCRSARSGRSPPTGCG